MFVLEGMNGLESSKFYDRYKALKGRDNRLKAAKPEKASYSHHPGSPFST